MQRMLIQLHQIKLAEHAKQAYEGFAVDGLDGIGKDLQEYIRLLQEHDYMEKCSHRSRAPFLITGERRADREILDEVMGGDFELEGDRGPIPMFSWEWEKKQYTSPVLTRGDNRYQKFLARLLVAALGAAFLVGPMWLMILADDTMTALWSTTVFVVVFGFLAACVLEDKLAVVSATAAYAAVLVVFVARGLGLERFWGGGAEGR